MHIKKKWMVKLAVATQILFLLCTTYSQDSKSGDVLNSSNELLLNQYIDSKAPAISFDSSNIKQYWINKSVVAREKNIEVLLDEVDTSKYESIPLKIQLANVNESQDCSIIVFSNSTTAHFSVLDNNNTVLSSSNSEENFINYYLSSSTFHLEDTAEYAFYLKFDSNSKDMVSIKKIILSFSEKKTNNQSYENRYNTNDLKSNTELNFISEKVFSSKGNGTIMAKKEIALEDSPINFAIKIKNTGNVATTVKVGFAPYTKDHKLLTDAKYPFENANKVLNVVETSSSDSSSTTQVDKIIVDDVPLWHKNCFIAIDAKEDLSDIPNHSVLRERIALVKELDNGQAEITLNKPLDLYLEKGTKIRINGYLNSYFCPLLEVLQPGEEKYFSSAFARDISEKHFSYDCFPRDAFFVVPLINVQTVNSESIIQITNFRVW